MLVDTHAHLTSPELYPQVDQVIERAMKAGVTKIICASSNPEDSKKAIELAKKYSGVVYASVGLHPHDTSTLSPQHPQNPERQIPQLEKLAESKEVVAIGECGLDFTPPPPGERERSRDEQVYLFKEQVKLALRLGKPLIIHSRKSFAETVGVLEEFRGNPRRMCARHTPGVKNNDSEPHPHRVSPKNHRDSTPLSLSSKPYGVFHCYSAGKKGIKAVTRLGFLFGIDGNLTYDEGLQNVFREIPLDKALLETDAPWLAPAPFRGQTSEPAHVKIIAELLAHLKEQTFESVARATTKNAKALFGLD